jgi:myo-inositol-1-phosphate synthase
MKKIVTLIALIFAINTTKAQKTKVTEIPTAVSESFKTNFPDVKGEVWEKEKDNFEAEFKINTVEISATFNSDGKLIEREVKMNISELPETITEYIKKNYPEYKLSEASRIVNSDGVLTYEAEIMKGKNTTDLLFDSNGSFLEKSKE